MCSPFIETEMGKIQATVSNGCFDNIDQVEIGSTQITIHYICNDGKTQYKAYYRRME